MKVSTSGCEMDTVISKLVEIVPPHFGLEEKIGNLEVSFEGGPLERSGFDVAVDGAY